MESTTPPKPTASAIIEPRGSRAQTPREHVVKVTIKLNPLEPRYADRTYLRGVAENALAGFGPAAGEVDSRSIGDILGKTGNKVIGVEGSVTCPGRPEERAIEVLREALVSGGYSVTVREKRECIERECMADALIDRSHPRTVPPGWYNDLTCGKHGYKLCTTCNSVYVMSSAAAAGQAPSVHCDVCGTILIEWGGTKVWSAELVSRSDKVTS